MRGVTRAIIRAFFPIPKFQLTRLMRGVTDITNSLKVVGSISTHTPHARRDYEFERGSFWK